VGGENGVIEDTFGLRDEEFWTDPWRTRKAVQRPLMQKGDEGLFIGAPRKVGLQEHATFPVAILRVCKAARTSTIPFKETAIVAAVELNTYELYARLAFPPVRKRPWAAGMAGAAAGKGDSFSNDETAMISEGHTVDLAARLGIPAAWGDYLVTVILLDQVSNRCRMQLVDSVTYEDPEVERFFREQAAAQLPPLCVWPQPAPTLPSYTRDAASPDIPAEVGIALTVERVNVIMPECHCHLHGSFRLPVRPQHVVEPSAPPQDEVSPPRPVTAVVPIALLLTGTASPAPVLLRLAVPSYKPLDTSDDEAVATGHFTLDLCRLVELATTPQTFFVYAFSGEVMAGPVPTAFVSIPESWKTLGGRALLKSGIVPELPRSTP
jgi:hypothetical protein